MTQGQDEGDIAGELRTLAGEMANPAEQYRDFPAWRARSLGRLAELGDHGLASAEFRAKTDELRLPAPALAEEWDVWEFESKVHEAAAILLGAAEGVERRAPWAAATRPRIASKEVRDAIADAIAENVKAYDVANVCVQLLGLDPASPGEDPFHSKRVYVRSRLLNKSIVELEAMAHAVIEEYGDEALEQLVAQLGMTGVSGELKNVIFAANGPKPRIVLRDAINNVIEITENAEFCLVYDQPLSEKGLSWRELTAWWTLKQGLTGDKIDSARKLYRRLDESMADNEYERLVFKTYAELYAGLDGFDLPALIPQVYLHYDPYTRRERGVTGPLARQRMDFLMLFPRRVRIVIEVDGKQHYGDDDGRAAPERYAEMMKEDRSLRLAGYEVYRFGAKELTSGERSRELLRQFFGSLLQKHLPATNEGQPL